MRFAHRLAATITGVALLSVIYSTSPAIAGAAITEYPIPVKDRGPLAITLGSDGDLWFTETATNALGTVTPAGSITESAGLSGPAQDIAVSSGGDLWLTEPGARRIARVTASRVLTEYQVPDGLAPADIAAGPDGNMWFTAAGLSGGAIGRITPAGAITTFTAGLLGGAEPGAITAGSDGNLWFTEAGLLAQSIGQITPGGTITQFTTGLRDGAQPDGIAAGPDGNVWFTEPGYPGSIGKITPSGAITEFTTGLTAGSQPTGIVAGADGNLWFTESADPGRIGTITPAGAISEIPTPTANSDPTGIAAGPDRTLWFTEGRAGGQIGTLTIPQPTPTPTPTPTVTTGDALDLAQSSATLTGTIDPDGAATSYHFQWGSTTAYGASVPATDASAGQGNSVQDVSQLLAGLAPGETYHYRLVASNCAGCAAGTVSGADATFTTPEPVTVVSKPPAPVAALGRAGVGAVLSGTVLVRVPGAASLVALAARSSLPVGSLVDASRGTLRLTTAIDRAGHTQSALIWGGSFVLGQSAARGGMTTLTLAGALSCPVPGHLARDLRAATASKRKPPQRSLWAHDNHGSYSTRGYNSVATVRGTIWETIDTCAGTLTFVKRGVVVVRDLRRDRSVTVRAGHSYLAKR